VGKEVRDLCEIGKIFVYASTWYVPTHKRLRGVNSSLRLILISAGWVLSIQSSFVASWRIGHMTVMDRTEERPTDSVLESVRKKAPEAVWQRFGEHGARRYVGAFKFPFRYIWRLSRGSGLLKKVGQIPARPSDSVCIIRREPDQYRSGKIYKLH